MWELKFYSHKNKISDQGSPTFSLISSLFLAQQTKLILHLPRDRILRPIMLKSDASTVRQSQPDTGYLERLNEARKRFSDVSVDIRGINVAYQENIC